MTRFARSKGSKSSNERIPEPPTPWNVMQDQLQDKMKNSKDAVKRAEFEAMRKENYEKFLKEEKAKSITKSWCEFDNESKSKPTDESAASDIKPNENSEIKMSKNKLKKLKRQSALLASGDKPPADDNKQVKKNPVKSSKPSKSKDSDNESVLNEDDPEFIKWCDEPFDKDTQDQYDSLTAQLDKICGKEEQGASAKDDGDTKKNKKKNRKRKLKNESNTDDDIEIPVPDISSSKENKKITSDHDSNPDNPDNIQSNEQEVQIKSKKSKKKDKKKLQIEGNEIEQPTLTTSSNEPPKKKKKNKQMDTLPDNYSKQQRNTKMNKKSNPNTKEHARRKPLALETTILIVNGEKLEVTNYDGFPILLKDAERIQGLRKSLISKGIPKSEVDRTIKLERRRAEKNLARMKKKLCFHCRKGGHNLSECPELNKEGDNGMPSSGICFKCGSTEHTHFACRVVKAQEFKFAQCFICKEQGHISRQCPDNPRGLYPKGGGCRECGDVTHLKKDCPKIMQKREDDSVRLETLEADNVEAMETQVTAAPVEKKSKTKHVKF